MPIFRYPGGKSRLIQPISEQISKLPLGIFHDVFVGGGSVLVHIAKTFPKTTLFANDLDENIYSFWSVVANGTTEEASELVELLKRQPTMQLFNALRADPPTTKFSRVERAYRAVFFNRTTFSGISTAGAIGGIEQKSKWSVDCRYNADQLIRDFHMLRELLYGRLTVTNASCLAYLEALTGPECIDQTCYLDPPYYVQGKALYACYMEHHEHVALAEALKRRTNWVLSYDDCNEITKLYSWANRTELATRYSVNGVKEVWAKGKECLFSRGIESTPASDSTLPKQLGLLD